MDNETEESKKPAIKKDTSKEVEKPPKKEIKKHLVLEGKNITSKCGILSAGDEVKVEMLSGGQVALNQLIKAGYVS